jgi:hypothetical protein
LTDFEFDDAGEPVFAAIKREMQTRMLEALQRVVEDIERSSDSDWTFPKPFTGYDPATKRVSTSLPYRVELVVLAELGKYPPRPERERFSGGVNLSAQERNRKRLDAASVCYTMSDRPGQVMVAPWLVSKVREAFAAAGVPTFETELRRVPLRLPRLTCEVPERLELEDSYKIAFYGRNGPALYNPTAFAKVDLV